MRSIQWFLEQRKEGGEERRGGSKSQVRRALGLTLALVPPLLRPPPSGCYAAAAARVCYVSAAVVPHLLLEDM